MTSIQKAFAAEFLGTALLVTATVGSAIMAAQNSADNGVVLFTVALATGATLTLLIHLFASHSGAHFNPAVSLVMHLKGWLTPSHFGLYVIAQITGAIAGAALANSMYALSALKISGNNRYSTGNLLGEVVATAVLVFLIVMLADSQRAHLIPVAVGAWIASAILLTSSTSFANPAVTIGRMFTESGAGISPTSGAWFIGVQVVSALLGMSVARFFKESE